MDPTLISNGYCYVEENGLDGYEYDGFMPEGQSQWVPWGGEETGELNISLQMSMLQCHLILCVGISQVPRGAGGSNTTVPVWHHRDQGNPQSPWNREMGT